MAELSDDLVKRLRRRDACIFPVERSHCHCNEAADRIEQLEAALRPFAALAAPLVDGRANYAIGLRDEHFENARTALEGKKDAVL